MLVLSRKLQEEILIGDQIRIKIIDVQGGRVRLGIEAPHDVVIHRAEVLQKIADELREVQTSAH